MHDLVIRGGCVFDGFGGAPFKADIAVDGEWIVAVGSDIGPGRDEIDANGLIVTPGFVDLHTHYDAQVMWDPVLAPSAWHGVTTVVMGNCAVGFAPARPEARGWLVEVMESVEEIPKVVMDAGVRWDWETYPEYLDALERRNHTVDIGTQLAHIPLRTYVMGDRAKSDEPATEEDIARMSELVASAMAAGALGLACSRTDAHRLPDGRSVPGSYADAAEVLALSDAMGRVGGRVTQYLGNVADLDRDIPFMTEMARRSRSPVHFIMSDTRWRDRVLAIDTAQEEGLTLVGHIAPRAVGSMMHWRCARHVFMDRPSIRAIEHLPWEAQLARLKNPAFKAQVLSEENGERAGRMPAFARKVFHAFDQMFEFGEYPDYEPDPAIDSIAARAAIAARNPAEYAYDVLMRNEGTGMIYMPAANYSAGNFDEVREIMLHPGTVVSLSDGGAHCTRVVDASSTTFMLTHWARDRVRGEKLPLERVIKSITSDTAASYGLNDRGLIAVGYLGDLNLIDFDNLKLPAPYSAFDFPAGGQRLLQKAEGYVATIKRGQVTFREGQHCGRYPGKVIRGPQVAVGASAT